MIIQLTAIAFMFCVILNIDNKLRLSAATAFAALHLANTNVTFTDQYWYYYAMSANIALLAFTFLVSNRDWSRILSAILLSSALVSLLGLINYNQFSSIPFRDFVYESVIVATILELAVLVVMPTGWLNSDRADRMGQFRQSFLRWPFAVFNHKAIKAQTR